MKGWAVTEWLWNLVYPDRCYICGEVIPWRSGLCRTCAEKAPRILPPVCSKCGRGEDRCSCRQRQMHFARCVSPFYYEDTVKTGILALKNTACRPYVSGFAAEIAEVLRREYGGIAFDRITAVPLYRADERLRGFDPNALLAKQLARLTGIAYAPLLKKTVHTAPQKSLDARLRSGNLLGAFDVTVPVQGMTILLIDDIITTGATLDECAKMHKLAGAAEVYAATACADAFEAARK